MSFFEEQPVETRSKLETCIDEIRQWMSQSFLMLNDSKTEFMIFNSRKDYSLESFNCIRVGEVHVESQSSVRNLGVIFDSQLSMEKHVNNICKTAYYYLRCIGRIRKFLSRPDTEKLVHAFVTSRLDSCNSLLMGLPDKNCISKLQKVQNAAARIVTKSRKYDHITPVLKSLHWLPIRQRIDFKVMTICFKCLHGLAPQYLSELVSWYVPRRSLRSGAKFLMDESLVSGKERFSARSFKNYSPKRWNKLSEAVRSCQTLDTFKSKLKTHLFGIAFK